MNGRNRLLVLVAAFLALLGLAMLHPGARALLGSLVGRPDPAVRIVTAEADLRAAFNARPDRTRIVAWLSPT